MSHPEQQFALRLFRRSVLKQAKHRQIASMIGGTESKTCLDIGGDNGVISLLLRQQGGTWYSADLDATTVEAIRALVGERVFQIDGLRTPFPDRTFDLVVIIDFLEHIATDREFLRELGRTLKPGGTLVVNVPHLKPRSLLNRLRHALGLTDERHGHVRPGYTRPQLEALLRPEFVVQEARTYSRAFSETVDTLLSYAYERLRRGRRTGVQDSRKGTVVTRAEMAGHRKEFALLSVLYPALWTFSALDRLLFLQEGYKLILRARLRSDGDGE